MKVDELECATLDYWVAKAEGIEHPPYLREMAPGCVLVQKETEEDGAIVRNWVAYQPSQDWETGGPIIERKQIMLWPGWTACTMPYMTHEYDVVEASTGRHASKGETPLIAAMRAYVASKFGAEVPNAPTSTA